MLRGVDWLVVRELA